MSSLQRILASTVALLALAVGSHAAWAGDGSPRTRTLRQSLPVSANTTVTVENLAGAIEVVQGGDQFEVDANVVAGGDDAAAAHTLADSVRLEVKREGDRVLVHVHYPVDRHTRYHYIPTKPSERHHDGLNILGFHIGHSSSSFTYQGTRVHVYQGSHEGVPLHADLVVRVPSGLAARIDNHVGRMHAERLAARLSLRTGSGDIDARAITGSLTAHTGSGDVHVTDVKGPLDVRTGSGDVQVKGLHGDTVVGTGSGDIKGGDLHGERLKLQTGSGDINVDGLAGNLEVRTGSGDIALRGLTAVKQARIGSGSGDIGLDGDLSGLMDFRIDSGSGDITLVTSQPPAVHLQIQGSDIGVHWPGLSNVETGRRHYRADIGQATGQGRINTGSGDVNLRR